MCHHLLISHLFPPISIQNKYHTRNALVNKISAQNEDVPILAERQMKGWADVW